MLYGMRLTSFVCWVSQAQHQPTDKGATRRARLYSHDMKKLREWANQLVD